VIEIIHDLFANSQKLISIVLILVLIGGFRISHLMATKKSVEKVYRKLDDMNLRKADKGVVDELRLEFKNYQSETRIQHSLLRDEIIRHFDSQFDSKLKPLAESIKSTDEWVRHICKSDKKIS